MTKRTLEEKITTALILFSERLGKELTYIVEKRNTRNGTYEQILTYDLSVEPFELGTEREHTIFRNTMNIKDDKIISEDHQKPFFVCNNMELYLKFINFVKRTEHVKLRRPDINGDQ
mgnify:CR=1 FL=1